jgi:hypothetical protein
MSCDKCTVFAIMHSFDSSALVTCCCIQAGMLAALNAGLQQGWLPRGALDAAKVLQRDLQ